MESFPTVTAPSTPGPGLRHCQGSGSSTSARWSIPECWSLGSSSGVRLGLQNLLIGNLGMQSSRVRVTLPLLTILHFPELESCWNLIPVMVAMSSIAVSWSSLDSASGRSNLVTCGMLVGDEHRSAQQCSVDLVLCMLITLYFHREKGEEWIQSGGQ